MKDIYYFPKQDANPSPFTHTPLPGPSYIRLLRVLPQFGDVDATIRVKLDVFSFSHKPLYDAVSYTWGNPTRDLDEEDEPVLEYPEYPEYRNTTNKTLTIQVCEQAFEITENLFDFLTFFRGKLSASRALLWVDALCINQSDNREKSSQVAMMSLIFPQARRVMAWLGKDTRDLVHVQRLSVELSRFERNQAANMTNMTTTDDRIRFWRTHLNQSGIGTIEWKAHKAGLKRFIARARWFSRAWIGQEMCLANSIRLCCGQEEISWDSLVEIMMTIGGTLPQSTGILRLLAQRRYMRDIQDMFTEKSQGSDSAMWRQMKGEFHVDNLKQLVFVYMFRLVAVATSLDATDPKDMIYSMLGIVKNATRGYRTRLVLTDYSLSMEVVFLSFTTQILKNAPFLAPLSIAGTVRGCRNTRLPSWCPDYRIDSSAWLDEFLIPMLFGCRHAPSRGCPLSDYNHSGKAKVLSKGRGNTQGSLLNSRALCQVDNGILKLVGRRLDMVLLVHFLPRRSEMESILQSMASMARSIDPIYILTGEDRMKVMARVVAAYHTSVEHPMTHITDRAETPSNYNPENDTQGLLMSRLFQMTVLELAGRIAKRDGILLGEGSVVDTSELKPIIGLASDNCLVSWEEVREQRSQGYKMSPDLEITGATKLGAYLDKIALLTVSKTLFTTKEKWAGLGRLGMFPGDEVWRVRGSPAPLILRPTTSGRYLHIGTAYVHGISCNISGCDPYADDGPGSRVIEVE